MGDFIALYHLNPLEELRSGFTVDHMFPLIERLKKEPLSLWRAKLLADNGEYEHFGWSIDSYLIANVIDAVNASTAAQAGKKLKDSQRMKRPKVIKPKPRRSQKFDPHHGVKNMRLGSLFPDGV